MPRPTDATRFPDAGTKDNPFRLVLPENVS
jgi:hypothetical protein